MDVFNHIDEIPRVISRLSQLLNKNGVLIIANREREQVTRKEILTALRFLHYQVTKEHYSLMPTQEEIESFIKTLSGFDERHRQIIGEKLLTCGNYYIIYAYKNS